MDRISNLPDEIICHIGSFLSAKDAAFTKVLSKRWRNILTIISDLRYDVWSNDGSSLKDFVDQVVSLPADSLVRKFSLRWSFAQSDHINRCLHYALKHGLFDLKLLIVRQEGIPVPFEVFMCKTVAKLTLGSGFVVGNIPKNIFLPGLKTLVLHSVRFYGTVCAFNSLLSACPVLEKLVIDGLNWERWKWSGTVSSLSLKRLTIRRLSIDTWFNVVTISFDTPHLVYFEYTDFARCVYPLVNLRSVVEARLNLSIFHDSTNFIKGLKNVKILSLRSSENQVFYHFCKADIVFENLFQLSVETKAESCWTELRELLEKSPNLKILTIKALHFFRYYREDGVCRCLKGYSFLSFYRIEVLKIKYFKGKTGEMVQLKHILQNMQCLELLEVHVHEAREDSKKLEIMTSLLMLPRASSKCIVEIKFF